MPEKSNSTKLVLATSIALMLAGCDSAPPETPMCRVNDAHVDEAHGDAGCIIRVNNKLVTLGGIRAGHLDIPGGKGKADELSQCTAHRETFEETGFNVEVGKLLGVAENGFRFYHCTLPDDVGADIDKFPVPEGAKSEVAFIKLTDPFDTLASEWRYPKRHIENLKLFNMTNPEENE